jgi:hypothetical protein
MTAMTNLLPLPVLDEAAAALRSEGGFQAALQAEDLRQMILTIIGRLLQQYRQFGAEVLALDVHIQDSRGRAGGVVQLTSPVSATLSPSVLLDNDPNPARIRLLDLRMPTEAGMLAKTMLGAFNLEGRARQALSNPNGALAEVLIPELRARGAELRSLGLHFAEHVLVAQLAGSAL